MAAGLALSVVGALRKDVVTAMRSGVLFESGAMSKAGLQRRGAMGEFLAHSRGREEVPVTWEAFCAQFDQVSPSGTSTLRGDEF